MRFTDILLLFALLLAVAGAGLIAYNYLTAPEESESTAPVPISIINEPIQNPAPGVTIPIIEHGGKRIILNAVAEYKIDAVLISKHPYHWGIMNNLAPWDYALIWGGVPHMLSWLKFRQSGRFCYYKFTGTAALNHAYVNSHMSNNHIIPATKNIRRALRLGKKGMKVHLEGYLVNVEVGKKSRVLSTWISSQVRTDSGMGACEIFYVKKLQLEDKVYE